MAFFKKLKDRLFRSSSKLEEGLDAIVEDGGVEDTSGPVDIEEPQDAPVEIPIVDQPDSKTPATNDRLEAKAEEKADEAPKDARQSLF